MLEVLFGNQNIGKILLFLFVNGKCYGTQLQRSLKTALTPIQKALLRLEKGGLITSYYEGKTRIYRFNSAYPLLTEVEQLLKKAYTLLPAHEKNDYYVPRDVQPTRALIHDNGKHALIAFWERLQDVTQLNFMAHTKSPEGHGWNGKGKGDVYVVRENGHTLLFNEKGKWKTKQGDDVDFSNSFRWTLDRDAGVIALEHLRHGVDRPVFLFHLTPTGKHSLASIDSHLCGGDTYFGQVQFDKYGMRLNWRIIGPKKNEEIDYTYS